MGCAGAQYSVPAGEKVLPKNTCPLIKSALGFKLERICPYFQVSDYVIGETTCDGKKKAWEILNEYIPTYVLELPQKKQPKDITLWTEEIEEFAIFVERETGVALTKENLQAGIEKMLLLRHSQKP